jgi:hypothetical protein
MIGPEKLGIPGGHFYEDGKVRSFDGGYTPVKSEPAFKTTRDFPILRASEDYCLRDFGHGVTGVCLTTKMGVWTPEAVQGVSEELDRGKMGSITA